MKALSPLALGLGIAAWSAAEYSLHRWIGHGPKKKRPDSLAAQLSPAGLIAEFNAEHLAHHANPQYFAPTSHKVAAAAVVSTALAALASTIVGRRHGTSPGAGFGAAYLGYELLHRRIHTHPPTSAYGRWRRRHHLLHHHRSPRDNHGVSSGLWDVVFNTAVPLERVKVPRRMVPAWLVDADGAVLAPFADDYELVGTPAPTKEPR